MIINAFRNFLCFGLNIYFGACSILYYMLEFQQKRKARKLLYSRTALVGFCLLAVIFIKATWNVYEKERTSRDYVSSAQAQLDKLTLQKTNVSNAVAALRTSQGVEAEIRKKFRVVKDGEQIAVIVDDSATVSSDVTTATSSEKGFWQGIAGFFGF